MPVAPSCDAAAAPSATTSADRRRAVVTGAGRGIGRAVAVALLRAGCDVFGAARTGSELANIGAEAAAGAISAIGRFTPMGTDVRDSPAVARLMAEAAGPAGLDLLACCAGIGRLGGIADTTPEDFTDMTLTNLVAPFLCLHHARAALSRARGTAVFLVSRAARATYPNTVGYGAGKAGLVYLIGAAARDLAPAGVRVIGLSPGAVATPMRAALFPDEDPDGLIQSDEVADALMALLDPRLAGISGSVVDQPW